MGERGVRKAVGPAAGSPPLPAYLTLVIAYEGNAFRGRLLAEDPTSWRACS